MRRSRFGAAIRHGASGQRGHRASGIGWTKIIPVLPLLRGLLGEFEKKMAGGVALMTISLLY